MHTQHVERGGGGYPLVLLEHLGDESPRDLDAIGDTAVLQYPLLGFVCSIQCPGSVIIRAIDAVHSLVEAGMVIAGGFHSPMERAILDILLRGRQPVVLCPAKGLSYLRLGPAARNALKDGRLLLLSLFDRSVRRSTAEQAQCRNDLVAALSDVLLVPYASPGGNTWTTIQRALARGQTVITLKDDNNAHLVEAGVLAVDADEIGTAVRTMLATGKVQGKSQSSRDGSEGGIPWRE